MWLIDNLPWLAIALGLAILLGAIVYRLIKNKKSGKSSCGCGCNGCALRGSCHAQNNQEQKNS